MGRLTALIRKDLAEQSIRRRSLLEVLELAGKHLVPDQSAYRPDRNFEHLLGPLDRLADLLSGPLLEVLGDVVDDKRVTSGVAEAAKDVYTRAVATVLSVIDSIDVNHSVLKKSVAWMVAGIDKGDRASIFTLNYDPLLDSWLLDGSRALDCKWGLDDEFAPFAEVKMTVDKEVVPLIPLRPSTSPRPRNVHLYHLHGGLHWIANDDDAGTTVCKVKDLDDLRRVKLFDVWAKGDVRPVRPHVLLTDQKTQRVTVEPFASAYEALRSALRTAERVVIAGYGFGDKPLNRALADGFGGRPKASKWLIIRNPARTFLQQWLAARETASILGCRAQDLEFSWAGFPDVATDQATFWT